MDKVLLDASVFLEHILAGKRAQKAKALLDEVESGKRSAVISALCVAEVKYTTLKKLGHEKGDKIGYLVASLKNTDVVNVTPKIAFLAAELRFKYYDRKQRKVSLADAVNIATALDTGCGKIFTGDKDLVGLDEIAAESY